MRVGYFLSCEEYTPAESLIQARAAQDSGPVETAVTCPTIRMSPAVVAQAADQFRRVGGSTMGPAYREVLAFYGTDVLPALRA